MSIQQKIIFMVQGSAQAPYETAFYHIDGEVRAVCDCPAGKNGQACKHRLALLAGRAENIVSDNASDIELVDSWLPGSEISRALAQATEANKALRLAKNQLTAAKKFLSKAMRP